MKKSLLNRILGILLILYCAVIIRDIFVDKEEYQWDLYKYYACAKAYQAGVNPYDARAVSQVVQNKVISLANPPIILFVAQFFTEMDFNLIFDFFLTLKCLLIILLIYFWRNAFLDKQVDITFYLLCLFGFNSAIYLDLRAGNITIFVQCVIWLAFFYYTRHKFFRFSILIIAASIFKLQPILFIFLLLFIENKSKYQLLFGSLTVFSVLIFMQYIYDPQLFFRFVAGLINLSGVEREIVNPSTSAFLRDLIDIFLRIENQSLHNIISALLYLVVITPVIFISGLAYRRIKSIKIKDREKWIVFFGCFVYAVVANYFKDYSYVLLILPTYFIIKNTRLSPKGLLLFIAVIFATGYLPGERPILDLFWGYHPLFLAYFLWYLYMYEMRRLEIPRD